MNELELAVRICLPVWVTVLAVAAYPILKSWEV